MRERIRSRSGRVASRRRTAAAHAGQYDTSGRWPHPAQRTKQRRLRLEDIDGIETRLNVGHVTQRVAQPALKQALACRPHVRRVRPIPKKKKKKL
jgi:hypothetical protein